MVEELTTTPSQLARTCLDRFHDSRGRAYDPEIPGDQTDLREMIEDEMHHDRTVTEEIAEAAFEKSVPRLAEGED